MKQEKSLIEKDLEAYRKLFQETGDFIEGSTLYDLWNLLKNHKGILLKGEINITREESRKTTHNIILNSLELVSINNKFYLYWQFGKNTNVFLINKPKNAEGLESLSKLFNKIIELYIQQVIELVMSGVKLVNDFLLNEREYHFLDIVTALDKKDSYFSGCDFVFKESEQEQRANNIFGGWVDTDVLLGMLKKYDQEQFDKLMSFKKKYLSKLRKITSDLNNYMADLSQDEFDKFDAEKAFRERMDKAGMIYP